MRQNRYKPLPLHNKMYKKGELTSSQIITIVLLLFGFGILLIFLLVILDIDSYNADEICKLSVIARATAPDIAQRAIPLKCTTQKICITGGDDCQEYKGLKNVADPVEVKGMTEQDIRTEIEKTIADEMYDCWSAMGEGKLDLFGGSTSSPLAGIPVIEAFGKKQTVCTVCARIKVNNISESTLQSIDVNDYLATTPFPDNSGETYIQKLTDNSVRSYPREFRENFSLADKGTDEIAILFLQINTGDNPMKAFGETGLKSASFIFGTGASVFPGSLLLSGKVAIVGGVVGGSAAFLQTYRSQNLAAAYCGEVQSVDEARHGCSLVTTFDYHNARALKEYCSVIEGQP